MWTRRSMITAAAAACAAPSAWAQAQLSGAALAADTAILRQAYEALHPGLYRYAAPAEMRVRFDALARAWSREQTRADAYLSLSRFLAGVRCGHTYANFYNQRRAVAEELFAGRNRLPFHFAWLGQRMVVLANFSSDTRLAPGTEILSFDGRPAARVLRELMSLARADGGNDDKRRSLMEVRGEDRFESFDIYYPLLFAGAGDGFALRVRTPDGRTLRSDVAAIDLAARRAQMASATQDENAPVWTLTFPQERTALLTMPGWALYNSTWDWRGFLDAGFAEIAARGATRLVIDLRGNEGGLDCGHEIIARLIDRDLPLAAYERRVRFQTTPEALNPYLDTWDDSFRSLGVDAEPIGDGFYRLPQRPDDGGVIAPKGPRFRGEVGVLINAANSSATFQFADIIRANRLGRLIGASTGGNQRGINGGAFFFLRLPASGLEADLPLIGTFPREPKPDAGLTPDQRIEPTIEDIANRLDPVLAAALM